VVFRVEFGEGRIADHVPIATMLARVKKSLAIKWFSGPIRRDTTKGASDPC